VPAGNRASSPGKSTNKAAWPGKALVARPHIILNTGHQKRHLSTPRGVSWPEVVSEPSGSFFFLHGTGQVGQGTRSDGAAGALVLVGPRCAGKRSHGPLPHGRGFWMTSAEGKLSASATGGGPPVPSRETAPSREWSSRVTILLPHLKMFRRQQRISVLEPPAQVCPRAAKPGTGSEQRRPEPLWAGGSSGPQTKKKNKKKKKNQKTAGSFVCRVAPSQTRREWARAIVLEWPQAFLF